MRFFRFITFLLLWTSSFAQTNYSTNHHDTTVTLQSKTNKDTLHLYFPLKQAGQSVNENASSLDTFSNVWYSRMLTAMKEPILTDYEGDVEIFRFTWLRTFHRPISIRIQKDKDTIALIAKMLSGAGGYDPGQIITDTTLSLPVETWNEIQIKINKLRFWSLPIEAELRGYDGAEWILEGSSKDNYHFTIRWSTGKGTLYGDFCLYLLNLSGIKIPNKEIY